MESTNAGRNQARDAGGSSQQPPDHSVSQPVFAIRRPISDGK
jgi:hypothetical protein